MLYFYFFKDFRCSVCQSLLSSLLLSVRFKSFSKVISILLKSFFKVSLVLKSVWAIVPCQPHRSCQNRAFINLKYSYCFLNAKFCKWGILEYCKNGRGWHKLSTKEKLAKSWNLWRQLFNPNIIMTQNDYFLNVNTFKMK